MKFSTREDIEAPIDFVFDQISDFQSFEKAAVHRGAQIERLDDMGTIAPGMMWETRFRWRGRARKIQFELTTLEKPDEMVVSSRSESMGGHLGIDLVALSPARTRMHIIAEMKPKNLTSRLLIQSLRLARGRITKKFQLGAQDYAKELESRYNT